jgi:cytochrome c oxidase subunit II
VNELLRRLLFLPEQASALAREIDSLHYFVIIVTMLGSLAAGGTALAFLWRYRRLGHARPTPLVTGSRSFEALSVFGLLGLFVWWWVIGFYQYLQLSTAPRHDVEVYVTGKQWMWKFAQPDGRSSVGVLVVPQGRTVRLVMTSRDVIHSFFVPAFRIKQDVLPDRYSGAWFKAERAGTYPVYCTEYCGLSHSRMWASVVVLDPAPYRQWLDGEIPEAVAAAAANARIEGGRFAFEEGPTLVEQGRRVASDRGCLACHTLDGQRHIGPSWRGVFGSKVELADGSQVVVDESYLTQSMMDPAAQVRSGFAPVMPTYRGSLSQPEVGVLLALIKSLRDQGPAPVVDLPEVHGALTPGAPRGVE